MPANDSGWFRNFRICSEAYTSARNMRELVRTIYSASGQYRAEIVRRAANALQVEGFHWNEEWVEGYGKVAEFWAPVDGLATFTDCLERADALAQEKLRFFEPERA